MTVRDITRTAVVGYLKVVRLPLERAISLLPGNGTGAKPSAELALDRTDAAARAIMAGVLRDSVLREDATRRRIAADKREQALRLHAEAQRTANTADSRLREQQEQTMRQRQQAGRRAEARREDADRKRRTKISRAAEARNKRLENSHKAEARAENAVDGRTASERLEALDAKADALRERERALAVRNAAEDLGDAASRAKANRKRAQ
jgi:hypothetical protein